MTTARDIRWTLTPDRARRPVTFVSTLGLCRLDFRSARIDDVELRRPETGELRRIATWLLRREIHRALGFPLPPDLLHLRLSVLPDLTGGTEPVELLLIDLNGSGPVGFLVVYEAGSIHRPELEIDLAVGEPKLACGVGFVRRVEVCILGYLFVLRGASRVRWIRRRRAPDDSRHAGLAEIYPMRGGGTAVDRERFRGLLARRVASGSELPTFTSREVRRETEDGAL